MRKVRLLAVGGAAVITNELISVLGYQPAQKDELQLHTRLVVYRLGRIWEVRCSARTDTAGLSLPETEQSIRPFELCALGFGVVLRDVQAMFQQATNGLRAKLYQSSKGGLHRNR